MSFLKFASATVLEIKSSPARAATASLAKFSDFNEYKTDDGFVYIRVRAISSRVNKNNDGWPAAELQKAYRSFIGKPIFVDHHNTDPSRARGVIVDAALHIEDQKTASLDPYYADAPEAHKPPTWIELLLEVDAKRFPRLAKALIDGDIDSVSMGANVEMSKCSHCGNEAYSPEQFCKHVSAKGAYFDYMMPDGTKTSKKAYEDCHGVGFFEISFVFDPADETALISDIKTAARMQMIASVQKEGGPWGDGPDDPYATKGFHHHRHEDEYGDYAEGAPGVDENAQVSQWQIEQLVRLGYPPEQAAQMVGNNADYHDYEALLGQGANHEQAHSILSSNDFGDFTVTAHNPAPQVDMTKAPDKVDTLRQEQVCPICGSNMEDGVCEVCNYEEPPEGFDNPDLQKAKQTDEDIQKQQAQDAQQPPDPNLPGAPPPGGQQTSPPAPGAGGGTTPTTSSAHSGAVSSEKTSANQGRVNTQERPILPVTRQLTDKPVAPKTVSKGQKIESNRKDNNDMTDTIKTAEGPKAEGGGEVQADQRVDVLGVGAISGDPLTGIDHENVEKDTGDFVAPHTDTWSGNEGDSLGQQDPVTSEVFEGGGQGSGNAVGVSSPPPHNSAYQVLADNSGDLGGPLGDAVGEGSSASGGKTWDSPGHGFPDHDPTRVDLFGELKEEVGGNTQTDPNEEFRSLKQTDPVTKGDNANDVGGPIGVAISKAKSLVVKAFKVAEAEVTLGLIDGEKKFERVAELEQLPEETLDGQLETLSRVKTAGLGKKTASATPKTAGAGRMPQFSKSAGFDIEAHSVTNEFEDSLTFG